MSTENTNIAAPVTQPGGPVETTAADDGLQRLRELGVPEEKLKNRARAAASNDAAANEQAAAASATQTETEPTTRRMSWDEIMADPEYNARMQAIVRRRLGEAKAAAADTLAAADASAPVPAAEGANEAQMKAHYMALRREAQVLRERVPGFNLSAALKNPAFARLIAPGSGVSLQAAYYAMNPGLVAPATPAPRVQAARPIENGAMPQAASVMQPDLRDKSYRQSIKKQMQQAAAQGRKLYPPSSGPMR